MAFRGRWLLLVIAAIAPLNSAAAVKPTMFHICGKRNPKLDECILNSVTAAEDMLRKGIPEIGLPPIEPLFLKELQLVDLPNFRADMGNVHIWGLSHHKPQSFHIDLDKKVMDLVLMYRNITIKGDYYVNAKILVPIVGNGTIEIKASNIISKVTMKYRLVEREGKRHMFFYYMRVKLDVESFDSHIDLKDGDQEHLQKAINAMLGENKDEMKESTLPTIEQAISKKVLEISNAIGEHFLYEELFPDRE